MIPKTNDVVEFNSANIPILKGILDKICRMALSNEDGATADVAVAKVGGGTRTLHFVNGLYTGHTDS